ncbi:MAG: isochorismatase family protein [Bacteriovoracaceae bacterium]|nr:isochorismatase family protein [Bacteriovoracaceae bacterium]
MGSPQHSQHCYTNSVLSAINLGFKVTVVSDGHGTIDNENKTAMDIVKEQNQLFQNKGAVLKSTNEVLR